MLKSRLHMVIHFAGQSDNVTQTLNQTSTSSSSVPKLQLRHANIVEDIQELKARNHIPHEKDRFLGSEVEGYNY